MLEENFRRSMLTSRGDLMIFLERPISLGLLVISALLLLSIALPSIRAGREDVFQE